MKLESIGNKRPVGRPRSAPEELTRQLAIRLTDRDREALRHLAAEAGVSLAAYVQDVLKTHMEQKRT